MCLGIPGKVIDWIDRDPLFGRATVEFEGVRRACQMACVPDAEVGEYVVVHAGIAISVIDSVEAERVLAEVKLLGLDDQWSVSGSDERMPPSTQAPAEDAGGTP